ncbi:MAG: hypothetical protein JNG88_04565 [Phycisphaerales bacterium]|nr:hypothetical protein [Phycisphaerales bacterium]
MRHRLISILIRARLAGLCAMLAMSAAALGQPKDPATWAPPEAIFFAGITDFDQFSEAYKKTADYQMMNDPALKSLSGDESKHSLTKVRERLATVLGLSPEDLQPPFKGGIALYVTAPRGGTVEQIDGALVCGIGDAARARKIYDALTKKCKERSDTSETVSVGSNSIDVFTKAQKPDEDAGDEEPNPDDGMESWLFEAPEQAFAKLIDSFIDEVIEGKAFPDKLALCLTSDRFIAGPTADAVRAALRQSQSAESLADSDDYKAFVRKFPDPGPVRLIVNIPRIIEMTAGGDEEAKKTVSSLGLDGMRSLVVAVDIGKKEYESRSEGMLFMGGERSGIPRLLTMDNRPLAPPAVVPSKSIFAMTLNLSPIRLIDEIERMTRKFSPENADEMRRQLENAPGPDGEPMNIRKDILENLREPLTLSFGFARPFSPEAARGLLSIGHRNAESVQKLFEKMMPAAPRDMREAQVYDFPMFGMSVAVSADHIHSGLTPSVESAVQTGERESLAGEAMFKRAAKFLPEEAWMTLYIDSAAFLESVIGFGEKREELKDMQSMMGGALLAQAFAEMYHSEFKSAKPDEVRALLKYYTTTVVSFSTTPEGMRLSEVTLRTASE